MVTLFDLRKDKSQSMIEEIEKLFETSVQKIVMEEKIEACIGCWSCWVKTPGKCVWKDQMTSHYESYVNSEKIILLLDTEQGFLSHKAKAFFDRTIPHYHPYIQIVDGECHHRARYEKYPSLYFWYEDSGLSQEENQIIEDYLYRMAYHFQSPGYRLNMTKKEQIPLSQRKPKNRQMEPQDGKITTNLIVYNGSPRRKGSNSEMILNYATSGFSSVQIRDLKQREHWEEWAKSFEKEKAVLFFMPLYVHAMPSHVMEFIEKLSPSEGSIGFVVQSGFPESSQSFFWRRILNN